MRRKNPMKRTVALLLAALMLAALLPVGGLAATVYKTKNLKIGSWIPCHNNWGNHPANDAIVTYKLKLNKDSIVTMSWTGNPENTKTEIKFYDDAKIRKGNDVSPFLTFHPDERKGSLQYVLLEGIYYLRMNFYDQNARVKVRFNLKSVQRQRDNYCLAKAAHLSKGKTAEIVQTADCCYPRWYKINLTQNKKFSVYLDLHYTIGRGRIDIYDTKMQHVSLINDQKWYHTQEAQPKGTYYIVVTTSDLDGNNTMGHLGDYVTLRWK